MLTAQTTGKPVNGMTKCRDKNEVLDEGAEITVGALKKQGKKQRAGKKERTEMEGREDAPRSFMLTMELAFRAVTDQNMFHNLRVCRGEKKASVMNSTVMTQFQTLSFIPTGLQGTLLKNLLPFHLSSNMTCFAALLQTHDIKSTDQSFQYLENILLSWIPAEQTSTRLFG